MPVINLSGRWGVLLSESLHISYESWFILNPTYTKPKPTLTVSNKYLYLIYTLKCA